jgi:hypothetical protein
MALAKRSTSYDKYKIFFAEYASATSRNGLGRARNGFCGCSANLSVAVTFLVLFVWQTKSTEKLIILGFLTLSKKEQCFVNNF